MEVVRLSAEECGLLSRRYSEHDNSHRRMVEALREAGAEDVVERLGALRRLEIHFAIDLASLCHRFERREAESTHPLERAVLDYVATRRKGPNGTEELWVLIDRVKEVRDLIDEGELVGDPEAGGCEVGD